MDKNITYRGHLKKNPDSQVRFLISDDYLMGYISDGTEEYIIEPAHFFDRQSPENHFIVYRNADLIDSRDHPECPFLDAPHRTTRAYHTGC
ncbi:MAG: hypothetical protein HKN87_21510 [Saprospiraceae bacterium]|nr:hypothetical protein [Saprospiraceae bacterium]